MTKSRQQMIRLVRAHIAGLQAHECTRHARIVFIPENNLGNAAQDVSEDVVQMAGVEIMMHANANCYGVKTLPHMREAYTAQLTAALHQRSISLHRRLVCENPFATNTTREQRTDAALQEFSRQLRSFQCVVSMPRVPTSRLRIAYTGKVNREKQSSSRFRDDMVLALLIAMYYGMHHIHNLGVRVVGHSERFVRFHDRGGGGGGGGLAAAVEAGASAASSSRIPLHWQRADGAAAATAALVASVGGGGEKRTREQAGFLF